MFEIGGPEVVSYGDMMRAYARLRGLRRLLLPVPVLTPHLSGLWLALVTPAQARVGRALVEGLKNATVVRSPAARETFRDRADDAATRRSIEAIDGRRARRAASGHAHGRRSMCRRRRRSRRCGASAAPPGGISATCSGRSRGWLDRWLGGVGMDRGRRDPDVCVVGDVIDGWTVEAYEPDRRLRLSADWKLPGRAGSNSRSRRSTAGGGRRSVRRRHSIRAACSAGPIGTRCSRPRLLFRGLLERIARRAAADPASASCAAHRGRDVDAERLRSGPSDTATAASSPR